MKKFVFALFLVPLITSAQDTYFVRPDQSLLDLNPSFAGSNGLLRNQFSFREHLPQSSDSRSSYRNTIDGFVPILNVGLALTVQHEDQRHGIYRRRMAAATFAQHILLGDRIRIVPSLQAGFSSGVLDVNGLHYRDKMHDEVVWNAPVIPTAFRDWVDISGGFLFMLDDRLYLGASVFHFNRPDYGHHPGYRMPVKLTAHASYNFMLTERSVFQVVYAYRQQGSFLLSQLNVNAVLMKRLIAGVGVSSASSALASAGYRWDRFILQFVFERIPSMNQRNKGLSSYELHFSFNLRNTAQRRSLTGFEAM